MNHLPKNKVENGRLVRAPEDKRCYDCVWFRSQVISAKPSCKQFDKPFEINGYESCGNWMSQRQLRKILQHFHKQAEELQQQQRLKQDYREVTRLEPMTVPPAVAHDPKDHGLLDFGDTVAMKRMAP